MPEENEGRIDYPLGYTSSWRVMKLNPETWAPTEEVHNFGSIRIQRSGTDNVPLLESMSMSLSTGISEPVEEGWYQIQMLAKQDIFERHAIGTFLVMRSSGSNNRNYTNADVNGYSVLYPASERKMFDGPAYATKGIDGALFVRDLLVRCTPAPISVDGSFTLDTYVNFSVDQSYLSACWNILDAAGWIMKIDGDGTIHICPKSVEPDFWLGKDELKYLHPMIDWEEDLTNIPNRYIAYEGDSSAMAVNDDPDSPVSTVTRGRFVDYVDTAPVRVNGETLSAYCERQLEEMSTVVKSYTYTREFVPGIVPFSMIRATLNSHGLTGDLRVLSQTLTCDKGVVVEERAGEEIKEWRA